MRGSMPASGKIQRPSEIQLETLADRERALQPYRSAALLLLEDCPRHDVARRESASG